MCDTGLTEELQQLCSGLIMISETDSPVWPVHIAMQGESVPDAICQEYDLNPVLVEADAEKFFSRLTQERAGGSNEQKRMAGRFRELQKFLMERTSQLTVYKFGAISIDVFIVGTLPTKDIVGVRTRMVET